MWTAILSFIGGPFIKAALDAYRAKLALDNNEDQRTAKLMARELDVEAREAELNNQLMIAEQGRWYTALPRPLFAFAFVIYVWKCVVWDKVLGLGTTEALSPELAQVFMVVLTAYFGGRSFEKIASIIAKRNR